MLQLEAEEGRIKLTARFGERDAVVWIPEGSINHPKTVAAALAHLSGECRKFTDG